VLKETFMKRLKPIWSNLGPEDRRTCRRWAGGLFVSYFVAVVLAIGITYLNRPATDLDATTQIARLKPASDLTAMSAAPRQQH
jgi:hypothetical protein